MRDGWNEPRDKGPDVEETDRRWKFRKKGKKKFVIERRYIGPKKSYLTEMYEGFREWHTDRKYETERARSEALRALTQKQGSSHKVYDWWEYRIKPEN